MPPIMILIPLPQPGTSSPNFDTSLAKPLWFRSIGALSTSSNPGIGGGPSELKSTLGGGGVTGRYRLAFNSYDSSSSSRLTAIGSGKAFFSLCQAKVF
jgi:hypothetical protein